MNTNDTIKFLRDEQVISASGRLSPKYKKILDNNHMLQLALVQATSFLQYPAPNNVRIKCLQLNILAQPRCKTCNREVKMATTGPRLYTFPTYCCSKCFSGLDSVVTSRQKTSMDRYDAVSFSASVEGQAQYKQTMLDRYGVENSAHIPGVAEKRDDTIIKKYGSIEQMKAVASDNKEKTIELKYGSRTIFNKISKDKQKEVMIEKYGVDNAFKTEQFQQKGIQTMLTKYGVEHALQNVELRTKFKNTMLDKYGVEHAHQYKLFSDKFKQTMMERYGVEHALQHPGTSAKQQKTYYNTCMELYGVDHGQKKHFKDGVFSMVTDPEWLAEQHHNLKKTLTRIADELGISHSTVGLYFNRYNVEVLSHTTSQPERDVAGYIKSLIGDEHTVITNTKSIITPYELDVYIPSLNIAFELNGVFWHSELNGKDSNYHLNKLEQCTKKGIRLVQILDTEWNDQQNIVKSRIAGFLGKNSTIYARKTKIVELTSQQSRDFFNAHHIQGDATSPCTYGLVVNDTIVAAMSFIKSRFNKQYEWELLRYANQMNTSVVGGASKLLNHFMKTKMPDSIITYSDKRWNTGNMYTTIGFDYSHTSKPNYYYFKLPNISKLHHRSQFQKHKLQNKLETFDPTMTEWQNMVANGYDRIWDCGNAVFVWKKEA